jgi:hypothetical protein
MSPLTAGKKDGQVSVQVSKCGIRQSHSLAVVCFSACSPRNKTAAWLQRPGRRSQMLGSRHESGSRRIMRIGTRGRERGSNLIELALVLPLLFVLTAFAADLGRAFFTYIAVIEAAREGARYGVSNQDSGEMCARALAESLDQPLPATLTCVADPGQGSGTSVIVTVSCDFPLMMSSLVGRSSILLSHSAAFRIR